MADSSEPKAKLECACKAVQLSIEGAAMFQVLCHCTDCAKWNQTTPVACAIFQESSVAIIAGEDKIASFSMRDKELIRTFCKECGSRLYNQKLGYAFRSLPANCLEGFRVEPQAHIHCADAKPEVLRQYKDDGLSKFADRSPVAGGSGKLVTI